MTEADLAKTMEGLPLELENLVTQLEAWEVMISAGYQCPAAGISMHNAAKHLADIAHKLRTGQLIVVDHLQATSPVDDRETPNVSDKQAGDAEAINATDAAFAIGQAMFDRQGVSPFLREVMQLKRDNDAMPSLAAQNAEISRLREALAEISNLPGEINPSNYNHDDVCELNRQFVYSYEIARQALGDEA